MERNATPTLKATSLPARGWEFVVVWDPPGRWFKLVTYWAVSRTVWLSQLHKTAIIVNMFENSGLAAKCGVGTRSGRTATISPCDGTLELLESLAADAYT
jgi:hypothetical protein